MSPKSHLLPPKEELRYHQWEWINNSFIYKDPRSSHVGIRRIYVGKTYIHEIIGGEGNRYAVGFLYNIYLNEKNILKRLRQAEDFESRQ